MAYAYNAIDEMMGSNNSGPTNQNIFAPQGTPGNTGADQGSTGQSQDSAVKTSAEGDVNNASPNSNPSPKNSVSSSSQNSSNTAAKAIYSANRGKTQTPAAFQSVQGQLDNANTALAKKASDYAASQAASHNYNLDNSVADAAVKKQDNEAKSKITGLLNQTTAAPVDTFDPGKLDVSDANLLNTNAGIKELVARGQGPKYSPNMAAFDSMLLQADPNFQKQVGGLKAQAGAFAKNTTATAAKAQADAEAAAQSNLLNSQKSLKDYLGDYQQRILAEEQAAAAKANAALPQTIAAQKAKVEADLLKAQQQRAQQALSSTFGAGRADSQLASIKEDPSKYINWLSSYDPSQFVTTDQANQYNTINSLLGLGGQSQSAAGDLPSLYTSKGDDLYNSLVSKATTARQAADKTGKDSIQAILAEATKKAQADNARRLGLTNDESYTKSLTDLANQFKSSNEFAPYQQGFSDPLISKVVSSYQSSNPYAAMGSLNNPNLTATDVINQSQADKLNALSKDLGLSSIYGAGQYAAGGPGSLVNQNSFKSSLLEALKQYQDNSAKSAAQIAAMGPQKPAGGIAPGTPLAIPNNGQDYYSPNVNPGANPPIVLNSSQSVARNIEDNPWHNVLGI